MIAYDPKPQTTIIIVIFCLSYLALLVRKTNRSHLDVYDFFLLSSLAFLPLTFVIFPHVISSLTELFGVAFPFVIMFGLLFVMVFIFLHRLTHNSHRYRIDIYRLYQEIGLLKLQLAQYEDGYDGGSRLSPNSTPSNSTVAHNGKIDAV